MVARTKLSSRSLTSGVDDSPSIPICNEPALSDSLKPLPTYMSLFSGSALALILHGVAPFRELICIAPLLRLPSLAEDIPRIISILSIWSVEMFRISIPAFIAPLRYTVRSTLSSPETPYSCDLVASFVIGMPSAIKPIPSDVFLSEPT